MEIEKYTDDFKVLDSGCFLLKGKQSEARLVLDFSPDIKAKVEIVYKFEQDDKLDDAAISAEVEGNKMTITCKNADNMLGNGMVDPAAFMESGEKKIYHNFFVSRPGKDSPRMFYYTFYLCGGINHGTE